MNNKTPFLGFFLIFLVSSFLTISVISDGNPGEDAAAMKSFSEALGAETRLKWNDPNPCNWKGVSCSNGVTGIQIGNNDLKGGTLSVSLGDLKNLIRLEVQNCGLEGDLPSLKGLSNLQVLLLHTNNFASIPPDFFSGLTSLQSVTLDDNKYLPNWEIPDGLRQCPNLVNFSANSANINGRIPEFLGSEFASLEHLGLAYNYLEGALPASFGGSGMKSLWLNNQLGTRLLSGPITVVQNMTSLVQVWLHGNNFTGQLPEFSGLITLEDFEVRDNQLTGIVPDSLIKLTSLKKVLLKNNLLQGPVPKFASLIENDANSSNGNRFCTLEPGVSCDRRVNYLLLVLKPLNYPARLAKSWQGNDPCYNWLGIACDQGNITVINFQSMGLWGTISPDFASFRSLKSLILADNNLTGSIPAKLTELPDLELLNVENNELTGEVPIFKHTRLDISGNPGLLNGSSPSPHDSPIPPNIPMPPNTPMPPGAGSAGESNDKKSSMSVGAIIGYVCGAVALILLFLVGGYCYCKRSKHQFGVAQTPSATVIHPRHSGSDPEIIKITVAGSSINGGTASESLSQGSDGRRDIQFVEAGNMVISIQILRTITNNFSEENILGRGGFGTVYKGELHDGTVVAVKRMESGMITAKGLDEFKSEIAVLTKVRHRHLVSLLWYCLDGNERILVYEYMPQGTLSRYLFNRKEEELQPLDWKKRLSIALDVARGVEYLHSLAHQSFIHRDLKPSNILLGDDLRAKVSDFGLVRLAPDGKISLVTKLAGTFGYLAPEYAATGRVTTKVDIFSFGVILMELITGRRAIEESLPEESMYLVTWFRRMLISKESIQKVIDPTIDLTEDTLASISTVAELAGHCCVREPLQRPDMGHAVNVLSSLVDVWKPTEPDSDDIYGIDLEQTLPEALEKWRAYEGTSSFLSSLDNTQTSIPTRPPGFESFTSTDGR